MKMLSVISVIAAAILVSPAFAKKVDIGPIETECYSYPETCAASVDAFVAQLTPGDVDSEVAVGLLSIRLYKYAVASSWLQGDYLSDALRHLAEWSDQVEGPQSSRIQDLAERVDQLASSRSNDGGSSGNDGPSNDKPGNGPPADKPGNGPPGDGDKPGNGPPGDGDKPGNGPPDDDIDHDHPDHDPDHPEADPDNPNHPCGGRPCHGSPD